MRRAISESEGNASLAAGSRLVLRRAGCPSRDGIRRAGGEVPGRNRGGSPDDEPVGQRWGKVEPAIWRRRRSHSPTAPRCLRTAQYGRTARDLRRTGRVSGWLRSKQTYKRKRKGERSLVSSRTVE